VASRYWVGNDTLAPHQRECTNEDGFHPGEVIPCKKSVGLQMQYRRTFPVYETHPITGKSFGALLDLALRKLRMLGA